MNVVVRRVQNDMTPELRRLAGELSGTGRRELLRVAGYEFWQITRENFGANKPNRPAPWPPLRPFTIKSYRDKYYGANLDIPTLERSGTLMNSIRLVVDNDQYAEVFTECDYATIHQFGGRNGNGAFVPPRPYFPVINDQLTPYANQRITAALERKLKAMIRYGL